MALAGAAAWRTLVTGDLLRLHDLRFEGLARVSADELRELSPVQRGDHLLLCDTDLVAAALRRHPWIASVEVERELPHTLVVRVVERRAAALVELGGLYLVDAKGEVFKRAAPGDGLDLPVVTGIVREDWVSRRDEVEPLLQGALALVHPSRYEGFGLTPLEAMAAGTPAVVSRAGSLPEVVGDAALLADPDDVDAWAQAITTLRDDCTLRAALVDRGRDRASAFTWTAAAQATWAVYDACLAGR